MGNRANCVIIENGKATAYYNHWGALGCLFALEGGPARCREMAADANATKELMDWAFAEGGFLLDFDERRCITFGYLDAESDGLPSRLRTWPGSWRRYCPKRRASGLAHLYEMSGGDIRNAFLRAALLNLAADKGSELSQHQLERATYEAIDKIAYVRAA